MSPAGSDQALWEGFARATPAARREAEHRHAAMLAFHELREAGGAIEVVLAAVAADFGVSPRMLRRWLAKLDGVARGDWLPALAPQLRRDGRPAEIDDAALAFFRESGPRMPLKQLWRKTAKAAARRGS